MADLVTHACTALLPGAFVRSRWIGVVTVGTVLPDVLGRVVPLGLERLQLLGAPIPPAAIPAFGPLHGVVGSALTALFVALWFVPGRRRGAFLALMLGVALHLGVDVTQFHHGQGYPLAAPLDWTPFELGWIGSEATVPYALPLLALTGLAWSFRWWRDRAGGRAPPSTPPSAPDAPRRSAAPEA